MNIGFWSCIILVIPFVIIGVLFAIFKEKATKFVSGFNSFSKEEQAMYDKAQISRDIRNQCFIWTVIMLAGATLSCFLTPYMAIPTYIIWLVLFFREVHFDNHKAFKKYLLTINEQISNFAQTYPTNLKASSNEALLFMRRYRFANCSCFSCCFKDAYPSSNVQ